MLHRPTGACHTSHIIPPSRICATYMETNCASSVLARVSSLQAEGLAVADTNSSPVMHDAEHYILEFIGFTTPDEFRAPLRTDGVD